AIIDCECADGDGVKPNILTCYAAQCSGESIGKRERAVGDRVGEGCGICVAVDLELTGIGGDLDCTLLDLEVVRDKAKVVVAAAVDIVDCECADGDGVKPNILTRHAAQCSSESIGKRERATRDRVRERGG